MFYYLDGTVAEILPGLAVIDCGGVGYACMTTNNTLSQLKKGEKKKLYTYLNVGESIFDLYGFATQNELNSFKLLLGVSGVGPKAALAILSANTPEGLAMAIVTDLLHGPPGLGKTTLAGIIAQEMGGQYPHYLRPCHRKTGRSGRIADQSGRERYPVRG